MDNGQLISGLNSGIYIHIPFCKKKCLYCDFFSGGVAGIDWDKFSTSLLNEFHVRKNELTTPVDTLYIGGGTPSIIPSLYFHRLMSFFQKEVEWLGEKREWTMEVNPDDVTEEAAREWKKGGITRISMGVQSFVDSELIKIGRRHDSGKAVEAYKILRRYFNNISIDLMFGLPTQTLESWRYSIEQAMKLNPEHLSAYSLMFEDGTPFTILKESGRMAFPDDNINMEMWRLLSDKLSENGYTQYEISNYSKKGFESRHNNKYWHQAPYLGLGPSAHSYDGKDVRRFNPNRIKEYITYYENYIEGNSRFYIEERLGKEELSEEYLLTRMRLREGFSLDEYREMFGEKKYDRLLRNVGRVEKKGLIKREKDRIFLSGEGVMLSDNVILELAL